MRPDPIPDRALRQILEAANWAPSHRHTEPWRFIVFRGESRQALGAALLRTMERDGIAIPAEDPKAIQTNQRMQSAPAIIAIVCQPSELPKVDAREEIISTGIAVQNLQLAARGLGLGTFWSSGKRVAHPTLANFLGIEGRAACLGLLYIGYPKGPWPKGCRGSVDDKITWRD